uniref:Sema domain-containing protein n=1 Tax=Tetranychus urticae TaxID=32264 RepID=A0A158P4W5_TETUR
MSISSFLLTIVLCLFSEIAYSFRTPKHDMIYYYKAPSNVFLTDEDNSTTYYGIYLVGETIYINISKSVVNVSDLVNWKVINLKQDRLMFVHQNKPQILINQKTIKNMKYSGELTGPIIAFGDDEALHVPTILNPDLTEPPVDWNYLELLRFDFNNEKVSVIGRLSSFENDWKYIKKWKMTDYIHFDNKLYLLIMRSIYDEKVSDITQEISIMRLCLDKGSELISSAVEMYFTRPEFDANEFHEVIFVYFAGLYKGDNESQSFYLCTNQHLSNQSAIIVYYYFDNLFPLFEQTAKSCSSGANNVTLLHQHIRSEDGVCKKTIHDSCFTKENIVPSMDIANLAVTGKQSSTMFIDKNQVLKMYNVVLSFPFCDNALFIYTQVSPSAPIVLHYVGYNASTTDSKFKTNLWPGYNITDAVKVFHINKHPLKGYYLTNVSNQIKRGWYFSLCSPLKTCTQCFMYGSSIDCVWSNSICTNTTINHQPKTKIETTFNNCFKIIDISPLIFNSSSLKTLTIELDEPLLITESQETLSIKAGPHNHCTNITINGAVIECSMKLVESGEFNIVLNLVNDNYADVYRMSTMSVDKVTISAPNATNTFAIIFILFAGLLLSTFLFLAYKKWNKQQLDRFKIFSASKKAIQLGSQKFSKPFNPKILPKINAQARIDSAKSKQLSIKLVKSLQPMLSHAKWGKKQPDKLREKMKSKRRSTKNTKKLVASQESIMVVEPPISPQMDALTRINPAKSKELSINLVKSSFPMLVSKLNQASNLNSTMPAKSKERSSYLLKSLFTNPMVEFGYAPNFKSNELVKSTSEMPSVKALKSKPMNRLKESAKSKKPPKTH